MKLKGIYRNKLALFCAILGIFTLISWGWIAYVHGKGMDDYFIGYAFFSDLYSPMQKSRVDTYGAPFYSNYPPMANVVFLVMKRFVTMDNLANYDGIVSSFGASMLLVLYFVCGIFFVYIGIKALANIDIEHKKQRILLVVFSLEILMSGPVLFLLSRGNNLIFVIALTLFFAAFYEHPNKYVREMAVIALAFATALKIYPVFFGILLIKKGNLKIIVRTAVYGAILMFGPFMLYGEEAVIQFLQNVISRNGSGYYLNHVIAFKGAIQIFGTVLFQDAVINFPKFCMLIPLVICLVIYITSNEEWKKWFAVCCWIIWFPAGSYLYNFSLLMIPLVLFLVEKKKCTVWSYGYIVLFAIIFTPTFFGKIERANAILEPLELGNITWNMFWVNIIFFALTVMVLLDCIINWIREKSNRADMKRISNAGS